MEKPSRKRKTYIPEEYARQLRGLTRFMNVVDKLHPNREEWDLEGQWSGTGIIHFVDEKSQSLFADYEHFDCRTIKLVNYGRPAAKLTFFKKHRYWVLKNADLTQEEKTLRITNYINELVVKRAIILDKIDQLSGAALSDQRGKLGMMKQEIDIWREVLTNLSSYDMAISNYQREYHYVTLNYKYRTTEGNDYANGQEHLLNPQRDKQGVITQQRYNIIFVDTKEISREHPHQHKEIENFLNNFPLVTQAGKQQLYARPKPPEPIEIEVVESATPVIQENLPSKRPPSLSTLTLFDD